MQHQKGEIMTLKNSMKRDKEILEQLYSGNHLEPDELERAEKLLYLMNVELKSRVR